MSNLAQQIKREANAISAVLREHNVDAGVPLRLNSILVAGDAYLLYDISRGRGVRIAQIARLLPEITERLRRVRGDAGLWARLRPLSSTLELPHPTPKPLEPDWHNLDLEPLTMAVGRSYGVDGSKQENLRINNDFGHLLIAGQTRAGKSTLLRGMLTTLCMATPAADVELMLLDPKRSELEPFRGLPHTSLYAWSADEMLAALRRCHDDMQRRIAGADGRTIILVVEELRELVQQAPDASGLLASLLSVGGGVGIHVIAVTQHPTAKSLGGAGGVLKANFTHRLIGSVGDARAAEAGAGRPESGAQYLPPRSGAWLWIEGPRLDRIQAHYQSLDTTRRLMAGLRRGSGRPEPVSRETPPPAATDTGTPAGAMSTAAHPALVELSALEQQRARKIAAWMQERGIAPGALGHNAKIRAAYDAGLFTTSGRGGSNSRVIRAVDEMLADAPMEVEII